MIHLSNQQPQHPKLNGNCYPAHPVQSQCVSFRKTFPFVHGRLSTSPSENSHLNPAGM